MNSPDAVRRRSVVFGALSLVGGTGLAGCTDSDSTGTDDSSGDDSTGDSGDDDGEPGETALDDLDAREANVVGVEYERTNGQVSFDVTLFHDDDGEDGYANWWQVERLDGSRVGRRDLLHAHSQQPFTRSDTFDISGDVTCVVVRGHDQTHGYGGQVMVLNLDTGATRATSQGDDPTSFDGSDCP